MNKLKHLKCNAVDYVLDNSNCILIHVCNDVGHMNSGIAKEVRERIPEAFNSYSELFKNNTNPIGVISYKNNVVNMVCQHKYYGCDGVYEHKKFINYGALSDCLSQVALICESNNINTVCLPYKMGANRAGGDWYVVLELVQYYLGSVVDLVICEWVE